MMIGIGIVAFVGISFSPGANGFYDFSVKNIDGKDFAFNTLKGKTVLVVNTASECGYTPQYKELEELYKKYKEKGLIVLGFPANNFGGQEPGTNSEIKTFCEKNYGVSFFMMEKISVKGEDAHPFYQWLCKKELNGVGDAEVKWNFNKFLISKEGKWLKHFGSRTNPMSEEITSLIEKDGK